MSETNGWNEYKHLVLQSLKRLEDVMNAHVESCDNSIQDLKQFVSTNKDMLLREMVAIKDAVNDKSDQKLAILTERLNKTESKVSNIYAVGVFCGIITGVVVGIVNIIVSNFL